MERFASICRVANVPTGKEALAACKAAEQGADEEGGSGAPNCDHMSCGNCVAENPTSSGGCGWYGNFGNGVCVEGSTSGPKRDTGFSKDACWNFGSCNMCLGPTCEACVKSGQGCGWCAETGTCGPINADGESCVNGKGRKCSNLQKRKAAVACKAAEKAENEGGTRGGEDEEKSGKPLGPGRSGEGTGKSGGETKSSGGGGGVWIALGWGFFALLLLAFVLFGLWWYFFRYRPSIGHTAPSVPLLAF
uniref:Uncharacterized protein n=1 Tax=Chromera velia CCMP2878 TaxID=1169474 RepID=A0A0G4HZF0_9ALVE|eukprot:Cvel_9723.t1-p1 / transcript=Cvel_9723.t1 / gene=Cvel_9723 / organism=Chromera_velia_CCMP2878 / gene_product=hypothetical protein / transcript_product=hypothetical protein / location=Cvel_scaffold568:12413-13458(+) / protein_length=247 / sequence_SO=supercontig / SO=protein_coding / is_pseudo=false